MLSFLNTDVQSLHASALPEHFKPPGPDTFPERSRVGCSLTPAILSSLPKSIPSRPVTPMPIHLPKIATPPRLGQVHLHHISVRPAHRRKGVASALLDAVRAAAGEIGVSL